MAGAGASKFRPVSLKSVRPVIPKGQLEKEQLIEDLEKMGCEGLILEPWAVKSEEMVKEFQAKRSNEWIGTIRRDPDHWTPDVWAAVYGFKKEGGPRATRNEPWVNGKFNLDIDAKDGHAVSSCIDPRERRVLEFVVPILYPEKPNRVTKEIGNTIFGALSGKVKIRWGQVIYDIVAKLVSVLGSRRITPLAPYLFHLYGKFGCLRKEEQEKLAVARDCLELGVEEEEEDDPEEESDHGSLSPPPVKSSPRPRLKTTFHGPKGKDPMRSPDLKDLSFLESDVQPFDRLRNELDQVESHYTKLETVVKGASRLLGDCKAANIGKEIRKLKAEDDSTLKKHIEALKTRVSEQQAMMKTQEAEIARIKAQWTGFQKIRSIIEFDGDIVAKAHLFDEAIKMESPLSQQKSVQILSKYAGRIEEALAEMKKLVRVSPGAGSSKPSDTPPSRPSSTPPGQTLPTTATTPPPKPLSSPKAKPVFSALKERIEKRQIEAALTATMQGVSAIAADVPTSSGKKKEPESGAASSEPSDRKGKKSKSLPTDEDEVESVSSSTDEEDEDEGDDDEEEEEESRTPPPGRQTRSGGKKAPTYNPKKGQKRKPPSKSPKDDSGKKGRKK